MLKDGPWMPGAGSHIPSTPKGSWTPPGCPGKLCSLTLTTGAGLGSAAGCTKRVQPRGISFRSLMTEKSLLGHTAPSPLPARAGLGTASIDFNSRSIEISSGEEWGGGAAPATKRLRQPSCVDGIPTGSALRVPSGHVPSVPRVAARR